MIRTRRHPEATQRTTRLEAFTDGVFAIAATLLVLDLTSYSLGTVTSDAGMWQALSGMGVQMFNFVLSFVLLCLLWMVHVAQFEFIARVDGVMLWLNNGRLLFVVLVPFATALTTEYSEWFAGRLAMPVVFFGAVLFSRLQFAWARRRRAELMPDVTAKEAAVMGADSASAVTLSTLVLLIAPWTGSIAFAIFALDPLLSRLYGRRAERRFPDATAG
ncbi:TMEM175 family protein [Microbacterium sp. NPDC077184]|uniref:TMEM175 family protein n=1 Tax=Microbacterium sp. NPDC077184 TaxID=3154764 RepID=UPI003444281E